LLEQASQKIKNLAFGYPQTNNSILKANTQASRLT